ncbi:Transmembrane protein 194 [Cynara cardunculus var. scolymus]|uniref:Transmembrane protein 194 n=1 Tax=Cynara cardunculus var. scolymus TaxID=59895 RepID=A0A103Y017_CYNCS|nr:Transmembrane protein 194 [Cynara cardunculus var. scolymus]
MATRFTLTSTSTLLLVCNLYGFFWVSFCSDHGPPVLKGIDVQNPVIDVTPAPIHGSQVSKDVVFCGRVPVHGISRMKLQSYAKAYRIMLVPSVVIPDKWHNKIQICFHRNASLGLCQCEKDDWRSIQKGFWSSVMSPYEQRFVDVKFVGGVSVSQGWRYILLAFGFTLLFLAPVVSQWVPFYYTSSMAIGVLAVVIILLYQGMRLLPTGRKSAFYLSIYTSAIGAGSFLVSVFVVLAIVLLGAGLGYWLVRRYVISEDGDVDVGVAQFIKWAMRVVAVACIFLSSIDTPLATVAVGSCLALYWAITSIEAPSLSKKPKLWQRGGQRTPKIGRAEFLSRPKKTTPLRNPLNGPRNSFAWSDSPVKGMANEWAENESTGSQHEFYSTFHKTPNRKRFSKKEWEEFTEESTRESVAELASSPEFTDWVIKNANRIKLLPDNGSDDDASGSDSTDGYLVENSDRGRLFNWRWRS